MTKKRTTEEMREYQRKRRAKINAAKKVEPSNVLPEVEVTVTRVTGVAKVYPTYDAWKADRLDAVAPWGANKAEPGSLLKKKT